MAIASLTGPTPFMKGLQKVIDNSVRNRLRESLFTVTNDDSSEFYRFNRELSDTIDLFLDEYPSEKLTAIDEALMENIIQARVVMWHRALFASHFDIPYAPTVPLTEG